MVTLEERLLAAAPILRTTLGEEMIYVCPKHPDAITFLFSLFPYPWNAGDTSWRCWLCLVKEVGRFVGECYQQGYDEGQIYADAHRKPVHDESRD